MTTANSGGKKAQAKADFGFRVYDMIEKCHMDGGEVASWNDDGLNFTIFNQEALKESYFKEFQFVNDGDPIQFSSFYRQLNNYGFSGKKRSSAIIFSHPSFKYGDRESCANIRLIRPGESKTVIAADMFKAILDKVAAVDNRVTELHEDMTDRTDRIMASLEAGGIACNNNNATADDDGAAAKRPNKRMNPGAVPSSAGGGGTDALVHPQQQLQQQQQPLMALQGVTQQNASPQLVPDSSPSPGLGDASAATVPNLTSPTTNTTSAATNAQLAELQRQLHQGNLDQHQIAAAANAMEMSIDPVPMQGVLQQQGSNSFLGLGGAAQQQQQQPQLRASATNKPANLDFEDEIILQLLLSDQEERKGEQQQDALQQPHYGTPVYGGRGGGSNRQGSVLLMQEVPSNFFLRYFREIIFAIWMLITWGLLFYLVNEVNNME